MGESFKLGAQIRERLDCPGAVKAVRALTAAWVNDFIEECAAFPNSAHEDQVDAMTHALLRWRMMVPQEYVAQSCRPYQISPI